MGECGGQPPIRLRRSSAMGRRGRPCRERHPAPPGCVVCAVLLCCFSRSCRHRRLHSDRHLRGRKHYRCESLDRRTRRHRQRSRLFTWDDFRALPRKPWRDTRSQLRGVDQRRIPRRGGQASAGAREPPGPRSRSWTSWTRHQAYASSNFSATAPTDTSPEPHLWLGAGLAEDIVAETCPGTDRQDVVTTRPAGGGHTVVALGNDDGHRITEPSRIRHSTMWDSMLAYDVNAGKTDSVPGLPLKWSSMTSSSHRSTPRRSAGSRRPAASRYSTPVVADRIG